MPAFAQTLTPVGIDLFGDAIVKPIPLRNAGRVVAPAFKAPPTPADESRKVEGYGQLLLFQDGRQLRGTLVELTADEVIWKRPDADAHFHFPRKAVRRVELNESGDAESLINDPKFNRPFAGKPAVPATVKLPGSDWLFGDLRSENGHDFSLTFANGSTVQFAKANVEWIYFGQQSVPAFGFQGQALDLEGWIVSNPSEGIEIAGNSFKLPSNSWIGRNLSAPPRFQVEFLVPDSAANDPIRLWIQPYGPSPNSYSTGTIEFSFGPKELGYLIFTNLFERKSQPYPKESANGGDPSRFSVFYDEPKGRVVVQRNGVLVGEWKLSGEAAGQAGQPKPDFQRPRGICFNRESGNKQLALGHIRVKPWNGEITPEKKDRPDAEQITIESGTPKPGTLEAVSETDLVVSGEKIPRKADIFLEFPNRAEALKGGDALLIFGDKGELSTADLRIREGRAICRTSIIADLNVSAGTLESIVFPSSKVEPGPACDVLVFRNGDSLKGNLLQASQREAIRWRLSEGQEVSFVPNHIAGVRLNQTEEQDLAKGSTVELTNGDRITGEVTQFTQAALHLRHTVLGECAIPRPHLQSLFTDPNATLIDAGADPETWLGLRVPQIPGLSVQRSQANSARVFLDGTFLGFAPRFSRNQYQGVGYSPERSGSDPKGVPERYELRCVITDSGKNEPSLSASLSGKNGSPSVQVNLSYGRFRCYAYNLPNQRNGGMRQDQEVAIASKLSAQTTRREVRIFVDSKLGTIDFMIDGVHFYKFGRKASERAPGLGARINLSTYSQKEVSVLSNITIRPWSGELPALGETKGTVYLANGDAATGAIGDLKDGKLSVSIATESIEIPIGRITNVEFGQAPAVGKAAARLRLRDGAILHVDQFEWKDGALTAKSAVLGELRLEAKALEELIVSPAAPYFPKVVESKALASKKPENGGNPPNPPK
jgi:hypothetical protein